MERIFLAKPFTPSVEAFESLGIKLEETKNDDLMSAILPTGWSARKKEDRISNTITVFDEKGRKRVYSHYVAPKYQSGEDSFTWLYPRYVLAIKERGTLERKNFEVFVMDIAREGKIFTGGSTFEDPYDYAKGMLKRDRECVKFCTDYLSKHFPDWENALAYWD